MTTSPRGGGARLRQLQALRPRDRRELHRFVRAVLGLDATRTAMEPGSAAPLDYLCHTFFESLDSSEPADPAGAADAVVWACRGGGKTMLGAVATLLDLLFKPGVQVRILGGSLEQSGKMYEHLRALLERPMLKGVPATAPTQRRVELAHGSRVELLAGSQRSVRGTRVHKLRCDEVEEFDAEVWEAAQLVTRSGVCGGVPVRGSLEAISTMHRPFGLMSRLVGQAQQPGGDRPGPRRVFRWTAMDVAARCPPALPCEGCVLWDDCGGRAKHASGFVPIEDLMAQRRRISETQWQSEMMCRRPRRSDGVYPRFDPDRHVRPEPIDEAAKCSSGGVPAMGMDFGLRSPTVVVWALLWPTPDGPVAHVVAEHAVKDATLESHLSAMRAIADEHGLGEPAWIGVDPAGHQRQSHSGLSDVDVLKRAGLKVRSKRVKLAVGIEAVRRLIDHDRLTIHPRCETLIRSMQAYHFDPDRPASDEPVKDGPDHACDALRYLLVNVSTTTGVGVRGY